LTSAFVYFGVKDFDLSFSELLRLEILVPSFETISSILSKLAYFGDFSFKFNVLFEFDVIVFGLLLYLSFKDFGLLLYLSFEDFGLLLYLSFIDFGLLLYLSLLVSIEILFSINKFKGFPNLLFECLLSLLLLSLLNNLLNFLIFSCSSLLIF